MTLNMPAMLHACMGVFAVLSRSRRKHCTGLRHTDVTQDTTPDDQIKSSCHLLGTVRCGPAGRD